VFQVRTDMMKMTEDARYEISVDGVARARRVSQDSALEAANVLKACNPHSKVVIRDLSTGETIEFAASSAIGPRR
jgi:hypothetical protein